MAGTFDKPQRKGSAVTDFLDLARLVADSGLTATTQAHRDDGFLGGEASNPVEFNYIFQRLHDWLLRSGVTLVGEHRTATITVGGTVDTGDVRYLDVTAPLVFSVPYTTQASDTTNTDIATNWAAAINDDPTAQQYMRASAAAAVITIEWLTGLEAVAWASYVSVDVGTVDATAVLTETVSGDLYLRQADDDVFSGVVFGSASTEDGTVDGRTRMQFVHSDGSFRAGVAVSTEWDSANRGSASAAFGASNTASGDKSIAGGNLSVASGENAVAIGNVAIASGQSTLAIGNGATATQTDAVAIGLTATASGVGAHALMTATSSGAGSLGAGNGAVASAADSLAVGSNSNATATGACSVGPSTDATGAGAAALGVGSQATATGALAVSAATSDLGLIAAQASAQGAIAISGAGLTYASHASAAGATVIGGGCVADDVGIATGIHASVYQEGQEAFCGMPLLTSPMPLVTDAGASQIGRIHKTTQTTGAVTVVLGGAASTVECPVGRSVWVEGTVVAVAVNGVTTKHSAWDVTWGAKNIGGTVTLAVGAISSPKGDALFGGVTLSAPTIVAGVGVKLDCTCALATTINWIGHLRVTEIVIP